MSDTHRTCEICGIKERHSSKKLFFARFPLDKARCVEWLKLVGKEDLAYIPIEKLHDLRHICEIHFSKRDFTKTRTRLKKRAVPKLHLASAPLSDNILAEFLRLNSNVAVLSENRQRQAESAMAAPAVSSAVLQDRAPRALTRQPIRSEIVVVPSSVSQQAESTMAPPAESSAVLLRPATTALTRQAISCEKVVVPSSVSQQAESTMAPPAESSAVLLGPATTALTRQPISCEIVAVSSSVSHQAESTMAPPTESSAVLLGPAPTALKLVAVPSSSVSQHAESTISPPAESSAVLLGPAPKALTRRPTSGETDITPRKKKLMMQLKKTKCTLASLKKSAKLVDSLSSAALKEFVLSAIQNQKKKPQGKRWTTKNKICALAIFKRSPKAYKYMQHIMPLPSIRTLQRILNKIPMEPGINSAVLDHLRKVMTNFKERDKFCTLAFDEISLKERLVHNAATDKVEGFVDLGNERKNEMANHALVFMLQGVGKKIKQPLAFYFVRGTISSEKLAILIKEIIRKVNSTGFKIISTICDQGPTNMGALKLLKEWHFGGENYFEIDNTKVFIIFDVPHLFKSIRNNFMTQGKIKMEERIGQWGHIMEVEKQNRAFLYLTKITPTHVQPKYRAKMRVKYAAQILSQTVAVVLKLLAKSVEFKDTSQEILETALVVEDLNRLFDFTNGPSSPDDIKKGIRENVSAKTDHVRVWTEYRKKLSTLKFVANNGSYAKNVRCIEGYLTTLKSLRDIWDILEDAGFKYLNLRQFNQDALENLFGVIRQHSPTNRHPTCSTFMGALKTSIISGMTAPHSKNSNCEKDSKVLLTDFHGIIFENEQATSNTETAEVDVETAEMSLGPEERSADTEPEHPVLSLPDDDFDDIELQSDLTDIKDQPLVYVSGYIASKILKKSACSICRKSLAVEDPSDNSLYDLIKLREWWQDKQCLTYPSLNLCRMVEKAKNIFKTEIIPNLHHSNICQWTITVFHANCDTTWLECNEHAHAITHAMYLNLSLLFIRRQCQRINLEKALKEEALADANKRGQQYGKAK